MTESTLPATTQSDDTKRQLALLKAVGLDRVAPEQREIALNIADRYGLDLLLKHLVLIEGRPYITRDGLIHVAHRSGVFDGISVTPAEKVDGYWRASATVYRKDMSRGFTYPGRYPTTGGNQKYAEEMAVKVAEVAALRRAFDVSAPTVEERWDDAEVPTAEERPKASSLSELARQKRAAIAPEPVQDAPSDPEPVAVVSEPVPEVVSVLCGAESPYGDGSRCTKPTGHKATHANDARESWGDPA